VTSDGSGRAFVGLVGALRARRDPRGRKLTVAVTAKTASAALVHRLLDLGAFVIRAGSGAAGHHLHHFPLRAAIVPRAGRLICVDLADYLRTWRPGRVATLNVL